MCLGEVIIIVIRIKKNKNNMKNITNTIKKDMTYKHSGEVGEKFEGCADAVNVCLLSFN